MKIEKLNEKKDDIYHPQSHALDGGGASSVQRATTG